LDVGTELTDRHRSKNRSALNAKLKGSTLGDNNRDDSLDAKSWIKKQKKRQKQFEKDAAERRQKEMDEADHRATYDESESIASAR